ncbi:MAG: sigma-70 family RNA polymerase sigma factor [Planctomycetes bacterium]|nr:sigma-70 family RNA polymerase sigma factor [Planctomycetota bacterium]
MSNPTDADNFLALLSPVRDALHRFAVRSVWRQDQASDVLQEAVMTAWRQFDRFEQGTNFKAWMFKILLNTVYRLNRKTHRARAASIDEGALEAAGYVEKEEAWASILLDPERVKQSLDDRLVSALESLAESERHCFLLRLLEDFSYREISEQLELPLGTVMSHVYRARMKLRERLASMAIEEGLIQ